MKGKKYIGVLLVVLILFGCMDFSFVSYAQTGDVGEGYNLELYDRDFATVDGDVVSTNSEGVVTILMFARTDGTCYNSSGAISSLCDMEWIQDERVRFLIIDIDKKPLETVKQMRDEFNHDAAIFCYCENRAANNMMWDYAASLWGEEAGVSLPMTVLVDSDNKVQYGFRGYVTSNDLLPYVEDLVGEELTDKKAGNIEFCIESEFSEEEAFDVLELVNAARAEQGLESLVMDATLMECAMQRAAECAVYYSHTRPNGSSCFDVLSGEYLYGCAENIAVGYNDSGEVMDGWLNSTGHYANIMGDYASIGVGCITHNGRKYWVQLFSVYGEQEKVEESDYIDTKIVYATTEYLGEVGLYYEGKIEALTKTETVLAIRNQGFATATFIPSLENVTFVSSNEDILCVEEDGSLVCFTAGEALVDINVGDMLLTSVSIVVHSNADGGSGEDTPNAGDDSNEGNQNGEAPIGGIVVKGDVTLDGSVDLIDAQQALKFALGIGALPSEEQLKRGDLNSTVGVDLDDANLILRIALGIDV